jgi:hypothetical protein
MSDLEKFGITTVAACQGFVEAQLEHDAEKDPRRKAVLEAYLSVSKALDATRKENFELAQAAMLQSAPQTQRADAQQISIDLEWTDIDVCHANVEQTDETFTAGAVYLNHTGEPTLETEAFKSVAITLSELKALAHALETRRRELPTARSAKI